MNLTIDDKNQNINEIFGDDDDDDDDDNNDNNNDKIKGNDHENIDSNESGKGLRDDVSVDSTIQIVDSKKKLKTDYLTYYAKTHNSNFYIVLTIEDTDRFNSIIENIFNNNQSRFSIISEITESFKLEFMQFKIIIQYLPNKYSLVKPDGLCGVRAIYMNYKFVQRKSIYPPPTDVDLTNEDEYYDFFNWLKSKYEIAIKFQTDFKKFLHDHRAIKDWTDPEFLQGINRLPCQHLYDVFNVEYFEKSPLNFKKIHPYKSSWNYDTLLKFIDWYERLNAFVIAERSYDQVKKLRKHDKFVDDKLWYSSEYNRYLLGNDDYNILTFSKQMAFDINLSYDYILLMEEIQERRDLCIFTDDALNLKLVNLSYNDIYNMLFHVSGHHKFGVVHIHDHFFPVDLPNDLHTVNELMNEIAKKIVNDYCLKTNLNDTAIINSDTMINVIQKFNTALPKYKIEMNKKTVLIEKQKKQIEKLKHEVTELKQKLKNKKK